MHHQPHNSSDHLNILNEIIIMIIQQIFQRVTVIKMHQSYEK